MTIPDAALEIEIFTRYLIGRSAPPEVRARYRHYVSVHAVPPRSRDERLLQFALRNPRLIAFLDAGCAVVDAESAFRRRLVVTAALLETCPETCLAFIARKEPRSYAICVAFFAARALLRGALGALLVEIVAWPT